GVDATTGRRGATDRRRTVRVPGTQRNATRRARSVLSRVETAMPSPDRRVQLTPGRRFGAVPPLRYTGSSVLKARRAAVVVAPVPAASTAGGRWKLDGHDSDRLGRAGPSARGQSALRLGCPQP